MNDVDNGHYFYTVNECKESVVESEVKPAAVMNHSTLDGVIQFYDHKLATAWTVLKSLE